MALPLIAGAALVASIIHGVINRERPPAENHTELNDQNNFYTDATDQRESSSSGERQTTLSEFGFD